MKHNDATKNRPEGDRVLDASTVFIDVPAYIKEIKNEEAWKKNDRNSITVFKTEEMRIVVGALHKDAEMIPHKAEGVMSMQLIEGELEIDTNETCTLLHPSQIMTIHKDCNYRVKARQESVYLLTMTDVD
jgi:hypothetical protein